VTDSTSVGIRASDWALCGCLPRATWRRGGGGSAGAA
jgi:hypothetical protein